MADRSDLAKRMKENYEKRSSHQLIRRIPVAIRIDGKAFHSFTRGFKRPFDPILIETMQDTMKYLCEHIQGCVLGYHQSDEITLILVDYQTIHTDAWFDYKQSKVESISASMATMAFNKKFEAKVELFETLNYHATTKYSQEVINYINTLKAAACSGAMFDSRAFNIPKEEVTNLILWRQQDATRNSIEMVGRAYFSDKQLYKKTCNQIQDMLFTEHGVNWNNYPTHQKRGECCIKEEYYYDDTYGTKYDVHKCVDKEHLTLRSHWIIDNEIPIFTGEGREYIEKRIHFE